ncbi:MAG: Gx transporter family protein [Treponema sp.]|nr:Gx transporter family protein [Treponema sp.]
MTALTVLSGNNKNEGFLQQNTLRRQLALLGAFCLFLSAVEYMIPKPLPFLRIGLANLPIMLACDIFPFSSFMILVCIKIFGQALVTGTLFSYVFLFSLTGTLLSALVMFSLRRTLGHDRTQQSSPRITFIGIGTAGAVISNISQLALAYVFIFRENVRYIAPPFLAVGLVTGIALGVFCEVFAGRSLWYKKHCGTEKAE